MIVSFSHFLVLQGEGPQCVLQFCWLAFLQAFWFWEQLQVCREEYHHFSDFADWGE